MRLCRVLLVTVNSYFAIKAAVLVAAESYPTKILSLVSPDGPFMGHSLDVNHNNIRSRRQLRVSNGVEYDGEDDSSDETSDEEDDDTTNPTLNAVDSEERVNIPGLKGFATKLSEAKAAKEVTKAAKDAAKSAQVDDWFKQSMTPEQVKAELKLGKRYGAALKKNKNYKLYKEYLTKFEGNLDDMVTRGVSTYVVWSVLGIENIRVNPLSSKDILLFLKMLKESDELNIYVKYVMKLDDNAIKSNKNPSLSTFDIYLPISKMEFLAKLSIRATMKRPEEYVKATLGLSGLTGAKLTDHPNYRSLEFFQKESAKVEKGVTVP